MAERIVTQIRPRAVFLPTAKIVRTKRVAAYARVSTDSDEQLSSVEAQKDYFNKLIQEHSDWTLVGIYADEGISGTSVNRRESFMRMINDAMDGKIDLIVTKSLSRFARNTVDALNTIRKLKAAGVGVYFEKEDIDTMDAKGEFLITLMSSLAEEESRSISENVKWGQRKRFADGKYHLPYKHFLGYKKGADGSLELVEEEAKIIRLIYRLFFTGYSTTAIARKLTDAGFPTPANRDTWQKQTIESILQNEKYYGAALLQKRYCADFRTKKMLPNHGELPMYYIENDHEPVVTKEIYDEVQKRLHKSQRLNATTQIFSNKLFCCDCSSVYGPLPIHSTTYNDVIWKCNNRHLHRSSCNAPSLYEEILKSIFHEIIITVLSKHANIIRECMATLKAASNVPTAFNKKMILDAVASNNIHTDFEYQIWRIIIEKVVVHPGHLLDFYIIDGTVIQYQMQKITPRVGRIADPIKAEIMQDYAKGKTIAKIATERGIAPSTIRSLIMRSNPATSKTAICQNCGKTFLTSDVKKRKYCSQECYRAKRFYKENISFLQL